MTASKKWPIATDVLSNLCYSQTETQTLVLTESPRHTIFDAITRNTYLTLPYTLFTLLSTDYLFNKVPVILELSAPRRAHLLKNRPLLAPELGNWPSSRPYISTAPRVHVIVHHQQGTQLSRLRPTVVCLADFMTI